MNLGVWLISCLNRFIHFFFFLAWSAAVILLNMINLICLPAFLVILVTTFSQCARSSPCSFLWQVYNFVVLTTISWWDSSWLVSEYLPSLFAYVVAFSLSFASLISICLSSNWRIALFLLFLTFLLSENPLSSSLLLESWSSTDVSFLLVLQVLDWIEFNSSEHKCWWGGFSVDIRPLTTWFVSNNNSECCIFSSCYMFCTCWCGSQLFRLREFLKDLSLWAVFWSLGYFLFALLVSSTGS